MLVGSRQPRYGIAKAKSLGYIKWLTNTAERLWQSGLETQQEMLCELALVYLDRADEYQNAAERNP